MAAAIDDFPQRGGPFNTTICPRGSMPRTVAWIATEMDTGTDDLLARVDDGVAVLTLNRPERRNALSEPMLDALARTLASVEMDDDLGCVVVTGAGGAFCGGGDVKAMAGGGAAAG